VPTWIEGLINRPEREFAALQKKKNVKQKKNSMHKIIPSKLLKNEFHIYIFICIFLTIGFIVFINNVLRFPDINDFRGLSRICLLMDGNMKYCVNNNWGFMNPLLNYFLTRITGNLLISQRILNGVFALCTVLFFLIILHKYGKLNNVKILLLFNITFLLNPWFIETVISVHMDIAGIMFLFTGLYLLDTKKPSLIFLSGILTAMSYWFRFHFLLLAVLFPFLVWFVHRKNNGFKSAKISALGTMPMISIPFILTYIVYGTFSVSNQKSIIRFFLLGPYNASIESYLKLDNMNLASILSQVNWLNVFDLRIHQQKIIVWALLFLLFGLIAWFIIRMKKNDHFKTFNNDDFLNHIIPFGIYILIGFYPFIYIRGFTIRIEAIIVLPIIMLLGILIQRARSYYWTAIFSLCLIYCGISGLRYIQALNNRNISYNTRQKIILNTIPSSSLKEHPERILNTTNFYNPYHPYLICSPVIYGGWSVESIPFRERFGLFFLKNKHRADDFRPYDYLILNKTQGFLKYNRDILMAGKILTNTKNFVIIQVNHANK